MEEPAGAMKLRRFRACAPWRKEEVGAQPANGRITSKRKGRLKFEELEVSCFHVLMSCCWLASWLLGAKLSGLQPVPCAWPCVVAWFDLSAKGVCLMGF